MRSNPAHRLSFFPTPKYFTILFKFLDLLWSLDWFKVRFRVIISEFYMAWRKKFTKIFTYVCPPCPDGVDIAYVKTG